METCEHTQMGVRDKLAYLGIYARPELYEFSGRCTVTTQTGTIDIGAFYPYGIALPSTAVDSIAEMDLSGVQKIVFIENKTNYDEYLISELEPDTLAVYHGGFLSPQKRKLFSKIADAACKSIWKRTNRSTTQKAFGWERNFLYHKWQKNHCFAGCSTLQF